MEPPFSLKGFVGLLFLALLATGCGVKGKLQTASDIAAEDKAIVGSWISEKLNDKGGRTLLTLNVAHGERGVNVKVVDLDGTQHDISNGHYSNDGKTLSFDFNMINDFSSSYTVTDKQLAFEDEIYDKVTGDLGTGPRLAGSIQFSNVNADVSTQSEKGLETDFVPGEILVKNKSSSYEKVILNFDNTPSLAALSVTEDAPELSERVFGFFEKSTKIRQLTKDKIEALRRAGVEAVPNAILKIQSPTDPADPLFEAQWNLQAISMTDAWEISDSATEVVVAVIDTGIVSHPDLEGRVLFDQGFDFISAGPNGSTALAMDSDGRDPDPTDPGDRQHPPTMPQSDSTWHGTHIAGIIAANRDHAGIAGIAPHAKILPLRALGLNGDGTVEDVAEAIRYAAKLDNVVDKKCADPSLENGIPTLDPAKCAILQARPKAQVINLSLGGTLSASQAGPLIEAVDAASGAGVVIVAAAGNEGVNSSNFYPAADRNVLSIGSVYANLDLAARSNYGQRQFLVAPGGSNVATILSTISPHVPELNGYGGQPGTSQAAAHISGVVAMLVSENANLTPEHVKAILQSSAIDLGEEGWDPRFGYGLVNPCRALMLATGASDEEASSLKVTSTSVNFSNYGRFHTILASQGCGGAGVTDVVVTPQTSDGGDWLQASVPVAAQPSRPTQISLSVSRAGLAPGNYSGTVILDSSLGHQEIQVVMTVASDTVLAGGPEDLRREIDKFLEDHESGTGGSSADPEVPDMGTVTLILMDMASGKVVARTATDASARYQFEFSSWSGLVPGTYHVVAGIDENEDGHICVEGIQEPCLLYPSSEAPEAFIVGVDTQRNDLVLTF